MCETCLEPGTNRKKCARCKAVYYCSRGCQVLHWTSHKLQCDLLVEQAAAGRETTPALKVQLGLQAAHPAYSYFVIPPDSNNNIGVIFEDKMVALMFTAFSKRARRGGAHSLAIMHKQLMEHSKGQINGEHLKAQLEAEYGLAMDVTAEEAALTPTEMEEAAQFLKSNAALVEKLRLQEAKAAAAKK